MQKKRKIRFAFYVSGGASRLIRLIKQKSNVLADTVLVVNDNTPQHTLKELLSKIPVSYTEINYEDLKLAGDQKNIHISNLLLEEFKKHNIDYCFCFGGRILKGNLLNVYKNKIINFHPAILPLFPGVKSIDQALEKETFLLGNTAIFIDEGVDTGPVIMQNVLHSKNYVDYESVLGMQIPMIEQIHQWIKSDRLSMVDNKVFIKDADYSYPVFYPKLEIKQ